MTQETDELGISATFWQEESPQTEPEPALVGALDADSDGLDWLELTGDCHDLGFPGRGERKLPSDANRRRAAFRALPLFSLQLCKV